MTHRVKPKSNLSDDIKRCVIYVRVSTAEQATEGVSLVMQQNRCEAHAVMRGWQVAQVFVEEGVSGRLGSRPQLDALRKYVKTAESAGIPTAVIVYSLSRLGRSVRNLHELFDELRVVSVTESLDATTAVGRFIVTILGGLAEFEADLIRERTVAALAQVQADGRHVGRPPFGWRVNESGVLETDPETWVIVDGIFRRSHFGKAYCARFFNLHETQVTRILNDVRNRKEFERQNPNGIFP